MYSWFIQGHLGSVKKVILVMEKRKAAASNMIVELNKLKTKLKERLDNNLIPIGAKKYSVC